jgi:hypothetical protein
MQPGEWNTRKIDPRARQTTRKVSENAPMANRNTQRAEARLRKIRWGERSTQTVGLCARTARQITQPTAIAKDGALSYLGCKRCGNVTRSAGPPSNEHLSTGQQTSQDRGAATTVITSIARRTWLQNTRWTGCTRLSPT